MCYTTLTHGGTVKDSKIAVIGPSEITQLFTAVGMDEYASINDVNIAKYAFVLDLENQKRELYPDVPYPVVLPLEVKL